MLILTRRKNEVVMIGDDIKITVLDISRYQVKLGFNAPAEINIDREEIFHCKKNDPVHKTKTDYKY